MAGRLLYVPERDAGIQGGGDEGVAQRMGPHDLGEARPVDYPGGA